MHTFYSFSRPPTFSNTPSASAFLIAINILCVSSLKSGDDNAILSFKVNILTQYLLQSSYKLIKKLS